MTRSTRAGTANSIARKVRRRRRSRGYEIALSPGDPEGRYGWHVTATMDSTRTETDIETLIWSDIVRGSMDHGIASSYAQMLRTAWIYISTGTLFRLMRLRKGPVIAALYPVVFMLLQLVLAVLIASVVTWGGKLVLMPVLGTLGHGVALAFGVALGWSLLNWFKKHDGRFFTYYLMHNYAYSAQFHGANPPELEARMTEFTAEIAGALTEDVDEVLVVGHSSGAHLGVSILADLIRQSGVPADGPALSFLSLGQVVPMVSFLPRAHRLRADLQFLSTRDDITWLDVTAPGDGCAFALCDPVAVSGVATKDKRWPIVISAAFTQTLSKERWQALRWRFFRLHFQYLCAFDRPGDYDYFRVTAGPMTLGARFKGRSSSKSRIEAAVSSNRSVTP